MRILRTIAAGVLALCLGSPLALAFDFPKLTGPVVDQADILTAASRSDIAAKSIALQEKSGIQLVVATVRSLEGSDIETYANQLFRAWQLGQAQKNNGVLLLVAPAEHKVRIEVGYGLEGTLTDALSSAIISGAIIPRFKTNDFTGGIDRGVDGIISVLNGDITDWQPKPQGFIIDTDKPGALNTALPILGFLAVAIALRLLIMGIARLVQAIGLVKPSGHYVKRGGRMVFVPVRSSSRSSSSWGSSDSSSSSSSSSDSYSGGGGSSGGGGASGSW
ncbi:MAG TPA: TPM domain-containing protein [Xanthobacteraceae bacterium]|nr:TPM domain-containing protein [Xanthobacteraceae bacterium]